MCYPGPRGATIMADRRQRLLELYDLLPFHRHPLWESVLGHRLTLDQIVAAERQHFLRTRAGQVLRREALNQAKALNERMWQALLSVYLEECSNKAGPSHLDLIRRLCLSGGVSPEDLEATRLTPANAAAIALYRDIARRGAACHMLGAGVVEHYYSDLAPKVYSAYTSLYGMTAEQAETYRIHGPMDREHADRAFDILDDAITLVGWDAIEESVRDAFVATSLHYDGMLHAATGELSYWNGRS